MRLSRMTTSSRRFRCFFKDATRTLTTQPKCRKSLSCNQSSRMERTPQLYECAGVDEVGCGAIAGPIVAACCCFETSIDDELSSRIDDSKRMSEKKRCEIFEMLKANPKVHFSVFAVDNKDVDVMNPLRARLHAMSEAVKALDDLPSEVLIDGDRIPEYLSLLQQEGSCNVRTIVGGDGKEVTIAAASIIAKCSRDQMMVEYSRIYPHYEFEKHKGYPTRHHKVLLKRHGPCKIHRMTYKPIRDLLYDF